MELGEGGGVGDARKIMVVYMQGKASAHFGWWWPGGQQSRTVFHSSTILAAGSAPLQYTSIHYHSLCG